mgnify:FL=1
MRKLTKIISLVIIIAMVLQNTIALANVIEIGEKSLIKRGDLGFYTIQYWNEAKERWMYITYSRTYYQDKNGNNRVAYCVDPELDGVGWLPGEVEQYEATISNKITNKELWNVYKNGYPYVSYQQLGVETEDDAYLATKQAAYFVLRKWPLEKVYDYFRGGQDPINEQNLEDINRRGRKVVDAIYNLVNIAYNNSQNMPVVSIKQSGGLVEEKDGKNYSSSYILEKTSGDISMKVKSIEGAPQGTYVADKNGQQKESFNGGEQLKIMIPKDQIKKEYDIKINYEITLKNYPVYYARSEQENSQNYVVIGENNEKFNGIINTKIGAGKSIINIVKLDEENKESISGVKFNIKYKEGENIGDFVTDEEGKIEVKDVHQGTVIVTEMETDEKYEIDVNGKEIQIGYNTTHELEITNKRKKGSLEVTKVDKDDNSIKIEGVEFELLNDKGEIVEKVVTDEEGKAIINNIDIGEYILKETKTNEEYRLGEEHSIKINWNEKLNLTIENEKKKGKLEIIKTSEDENNILNLPQGSYIEGTEFDVLDYEGNIIDHIITNEEGKAVSKMLPLGKYKVIETKANEWYMKNEEIYEVSISSDNEIVKLNITNKSKDPKVDINKKGPSLAYANQEIRYDFEIRNTGNVKLNDFTWYEFLPFEYGKATRISTGTYNQELSYNVYYRTNKKPEYLVLAENLSTKVNNYIDLEKIYLEDDEKITEIKIKYGDVNVYFAEEEKPQIYMKLKEDLTENQEVRNTTILEGKHNDYKICDEDEVTTIIRENKPEPKKLPRTGF